jgi:hypothetical protein
LICIDLIKTPEMPAILAAIKTAQNARLFMVNKGRHSREILIIIFRDSGVS